MAPNVIITRPRGPYAGEDRLSARLHAEGLSTLSLTSLSVQAHPLSREEQETTHRLLEKAGAWVAFLSPTAVYVFRDLLNDLMSAISSGRIQVAAQGPGTNEAIRDLFGRDADFVPPVSTAEAFAESFIRHATIGASVLVPQSAEGRDVFAPLLQKAGFAVTSIITYGLVPVVPSSSEAEAVCACLVEESFILFMSPSAVRATVKNFSEREHLKEMRAISIGPSTSKALVECGFTVYREAKEHSEAGVIACLLEVPR